MEAVGETAPKAASPVFFSRLAAPPATASAAFETHSEIALKAVTMSCATILDRARVTVSREPGSVESDPAEVYLDGSILRSKAKFGTVAFFR